MKKLIYLLIITSLLMLVGCNVSFVYPEKTITVTEYVQLRQFGSAGDLQAWLDTQPIPSDPLWNCVDYALDLQARAERAGYRINDFASENYYYNISRRAEYLGD